MPDSTSPKNSQPEPKQTEKSVDPNKFSEEEQMALYEEDLKESDWGHQPC